MKKRITTKDWIAAIDEWMIVNGKKPLKWETLLEREHGIGKDFFNTILEAKRNKKSYAGKWFNSNQTDFSLYESYEYPY